MRAQLDWKRSERRRSGAPGRSFRRTRFAYLGFYLLSAVFVAGVLVLGPWKPIDSLWPPVSASFQVIDGDTVRNGGTVYRLVGFNTPETDGRCERERTLAAKATQRLRELTAGGAKLERVACACPPGTEGTSRCNFGRLCARLFAGARDVAGIMINEGLAERYICSGMSCPPRRNWC